MAGITVGIDGSENGQLALEWAMKEAATKQVPLTVLTVNEVAASFWTGNPITVAGDAELLESARQGAEAAVEKTAAQLGDDKPPSVSVRAVNGFATKELITASEQSDLVVVGARGNGGFPRLHLGAVASQVVHHAACPVVVVRTAR